MPRWNGCKRNHRLALFSSLRSLQPLDETYSALEDRVRTDMVRYLAISNFSVEQMRMHRAMEAQFGACARILAAQNQFDLMCKEPAETSGSLAYPAAHGIAFVRTARWGKAF